MSCAEAMHTTQQLSVQVLFAGAPHLMDVHFASIACKVERA
jgi:hypothetical protein